MKYLILIVVVVGVLWLMRSLRKPSGQAPTQKPVTPPQQEEMVSCAQCGVHLPRSEALPGRGGVFCGETHRIAFERDRSD